MGREAAVGNRQPLGSSQRQLKRRLHQLGKNQGARHRCGFTLIAPS